MRLLVTGCGRSGTTWTAMALRSTGIDARHQAAFEVGPPARFDVDGHWQAEVSCVAPPYTPQLKNAHVVHLVRDPLKVIASMAARPRKKVSDAYLQRWIPDMSGIDDPLARAVLYYDAWNDLVVADERVRFEDIDASKILELARIVNHRARRPILPPVQNASPQPPPPATWDDVLKKPYGENVLAKGRLYGYVE